MTAPGTGEQPRKQRVPAAARLGSAGPAVGVGGEMLLIALVLHPADVAFVALLEQDISAFERQAVTVALARAPADDRSALLAFAVGACVERVLDHRDQLAVADRRSVEARPFADLGRAREVDAIGRHGQQDAAGVNAECIVVLPHFVWRGMPSQVAVRARWRNSPKPARPNIVRLRIFSLPI